MMIVLKLALARVTEVSDHKVSYRKHLQISTQKTNALKTASRTCSTKNR